MQRRFSRRLGHGFVNSIEAAAMCGLPVYTFRYLVKRGEIVAPTHTLPGGNWKYYTQDEAGEIAARVRTMVDKASGK